jgi:CBS-domain-containing membrane protein
MASTSSYRGHYVVDLMTPSPLILGPDEPVWSAVCLAERHGVHHLLVVDGYRLLGEICCCDLLRAGTRDTVGMHQHSPPVTVDDQATAQEALEAMREWKVGCLPVVDWAGDLRGVVTRRDLRRVGPLPAELERRCAACGSTHGLREGPPGTRAFCMVCLAQGAMVRGEIEDIYLGNGDGD